MAFKGLIFDLDGVLVDTVPTHFEAWAQMFHEYGYDFDHAVYREHVDGRLRRDGARAVMVNHSEAEIIEASDRKNDYYLQRIRSGQFVVFEAAIQYVRTCKKAGFKLAAASSSANVRYILEIAGILDEFDVVLGGNQVTKGKPDPEIFTLAALQLGLAVNECVVFEDSEFGVRAAKAGGFFCVGVADESNDANLSLADTIVASVSDYPVQQPADPLRTSPC